MLEEVRASGLTGRGGAGFPTAQKWSAGHGRRRHGVLVVNAMESEPASEKDSTLWALAPHTVLDGAEIAASVVGAHEVVICVADDNPEVTAHVGSALAERTAAGIGGPPMRFVNPPGRYVAGEESSLVSWIGRSPAHPQFRMSKATPLTIGRRPVLVQSTETLAHVSLIARNGAEWFRSVGLPDAPGTCLVTVAGDVREPGVSEVALGTRIADIVGAPPDGVAFRGLLLGGYGGTWVAARHLDLPYATSSLRLVGASVGAGVIAALSSATCGIAETARLAMYMANESAGQCGPCTFGLNAIAGDLAALARGEAERWLLTRIRDRLGLVEGRGACGHPDGVVRMVRSALDVFATDVAEHAKGRPCGRWNAPPVLPVPPSAVDAVSSRFSRR
jgi:NADH:ubiquinone oxidoreductase subunit F (NADH-binding)